jgi:WXG100 family type VII secretion target
MEVEVCRSAVTSFNNGAQELTQLFQNLNNTINGMQSGAWVGNSANEFFSKYSEASGPLKNAADLLSTLSGQLSVEVTEWENMAAKLG